MRYVNFILPMRLISNYSVKLNVIYANIINMSYIATNATMSMDV